MKADLNELYDRVIDLAVKVSEGEIDPFDVDVGRFVDMLSSRHEVLEKLEYSSLLKDIRALNGLIAILEAQGRVLRRRGMGLYLDKVLMKLRIYKMDINKLADIFAVSWKPIINIEMISLDGVRDAVSYFNNLKDIASRRFSLEKVKDFSYLDFKPKLFIVPNEVKMLMEKLYQELKDFSRGEDVEYNAFIRRSGDPVERAYLLSFLISDGWVDVKINRLEEKIWIKPRSNKRESINPSSLAVVVRREERGEN